MANLLSGTVTVLTGTEVSVSEKKVSVVVSRVIASTNLCQCEKAVRTSIEQFH